MKKNIIFRKKAVFMSIFITLILCLGSVVIPSINGLNEINIRKNFEPNKFEPNDLFSYELYQKAISYLEENEKILENNILISKLITNLNNKGINIFDYLKDLSYNEFIDIYEFLGVIKFNRYELLRVMTTNIIPLFSQIQKIINLDEPDNEINTDIFSNTKITNTINESDFDKYWKLYNTTVDYWGDRFEVDNFQDWFNRIDLVNVELFDAYKYSILTSLAICIVGSFVDYVAWIGWLLLGAVLYEVYEFAGYVIQGFNYYTTLIEMQVEILVHVVENTTEMNGIDGLWEKRDIIAISTDAKNKCDGSRGFTENLFTYYLGPANLEEGENESGWYSLKNRNKAEDDRNKDFKAPHPPGNWTIEVNDFKNWTGSGIIPIEHPNNIPRNGVEIITIYLDPK